MRLSRHHYSWAVPEKTAKNTWKKVIFGYQNHKLSAWPLLYFIIMADVWNFCDTFLRPKTKNTFFYFSKCRFVAEIQGFKFTPILHVKSEVPIVRPSRIYTFCLWQMVDIFVIYSSDPKLKTLFFIFQNFYSLLRYKDPKVPLLHVKSKVPIVWPGHIYTFCLWQMVKILVVYS